MLLINKIIIKLSMRAEMFLLIYLLIVCSILDNKKDFRIEAATQLTINSNPPYSQANLDEVNNKLLTSSSHNLHSETSSSFNLNSSSSNSIIESMPNFYTNSQASRFRVNVSNICERNQMRVTIRLSKPFYGLIHTKDRRKKVPCFVEGNGEQTYFMEISYTLIQSDLSYCGVVSHHLSGSVVGASQTNKQQQQQSNNSQTTLSVVLVVRLHKTIEFSDDRYFLLSCAK